MVALTDGQLLGAVRLVLENNVVVLRGMRVTKRYQRMGKGTRMLGQVDQLLSSSVCFCIPHRYLRDFYAFIGFEEIDPQEAPRFLFERYYKYRQQMGLDVIIMSRNSQDKHFAG